MLKARLIGMKWLCFNIGFLETFRIMLEMLLKNTKDHLAIFSFNGKKVRMIIRSERTDLAMLTEIFCFEAYEIKRKMEPKLIVDGGANKGGTAVYFGLKYPNAEIHCYEPNPDLIPVLKKNLELNNINAKVFNEALSSQEGYLFFKINNNHQYSKLTIEDTGMKVKTIPLKNRYVNRKIDILKLDVEGEEEKIIVNMDYNRVIADVIIQEIHYDRVSFEKIRSILQRNNYKFESPYPQYKYLNSEVDYPILVAMK